MPIHINLLAEAQAVEDLRRRDPVKRVIIGGLLAIAAMVVWCSTLQLKVMLANRELSLAQFQLDSHTNDYEMALNNNAKIAGAKMKIADLKQMTNARMLQGNLLNALQKVSADNVQLTGIKVDQSYVLNKPTTFQGNSGGTVVGRPASVTEKIIVTLNARDYSENPGDQVVKFRDAIARQSYFQEMLDKTNGILLGDESAPQQDQSGKNFVSFTLECHFPDIKR